MTTTHNIPAAEPAWKPLWTVNGDDASWKASIHGDDGECHIEGIPRRLGNRTTLDLFVTKLGCHSALCGLEPDELRAIRFIIDEQLVALDELEGDHSIPRDPYSGDGFTTEADPCVGQEGGWA